jgi:hypothetical protein
MPKSQKFVIQHLETHTNTLLGQLSAQTKIDIIWKYFLKYRENTIILIENYNKPKKWQENPILYNFLSLLRDKINNLESLGNVIPQLIDWIKKEIIDSSTEKLIKEWDNFNDIYNRTYKKVHIHMKYLSHRNFSTTKISDYEDIKEYVDSLATENIYIKFSA